MSREVIRKGIFETNSSSVHTITVCSKNEFDDWKSGKLIYSRGYDKLIPSDSLDTDYLDWLDQVSDKDIVETLPSWERYRYLGYEDFFNNYDALQMDTYNRNYITPGGEEVVVFGYFGYE